MIFGKIPVFDQLTLICRLSFTVVLTGLGLLNLTFPIMGQHTTNSVPDLQVPQRFQTGLNVADSTVVDLDGDGNLDLAVVNAARIGTATASILFGTEDGGFEPPIVLPTDAVGRTIAVGDLNNDGRPDVVVATYIENVLVVFLNQGNRHFSDPVFTQDLSEANGEYLDLAIADFDGDGTNDVVGLQDQSGQRLRFFHADAQGRLTVFALFSQNGTMDRSYGSVIAVGDVNGDHRPDVVWFDDNPNFTWDTWFIYGQMPGKQLSATFGWNSPSSVLAAHIADLDNDSDNDIIIIRGGYGGSGLQVFRNDNALFTALPLMPIDSPFPPDDLTIADFNNDGEKDLGVLHGSAYHDGVIVGIRYGVGDGSYTEGKYYATAKSTHIYSGDLNHDGRTDVLTASAMPIENVPSGYWDGINNNNCSVLLNENLVGFGAPLVKLWGPNFIDYGDFNRDGYVDMVSSWTTYSNITSGADISINDRRGGFYEEVSYPSPGGLRNMHAGDFNGDGKADVVTSHLTSNNMLKLAVYFGDGSGALGNPIVTSRVQPVNNMIVGDFNNDNKDDVFVVENTGNGFSMLSVGDGTFMVAAPITLPNTTLDVLKVDFNGDHNLDLLITSDIAAKLWLGDGTGQFVQTATPIPILRNVVSGDFNGDGKIDLAGMTPPVGTLPPWRTDIAITAVLGDGNGGVSGTFSKNIPDYSNSRTASSIVSADFDLDGFDDVAIAHPRNVFGNLVIVLSGGTTPSWKEPEFVAADTATRSLKVADFDGNGRPDIEWLGDNSRGVIYNGVRRQTANAAFDFDRDGKTDLSIFRPNGASGSEWWYQKSSNGGNYAAQFGTPTDKLVAADYTGDGKADIAFFRPGTGFWYILRSEDSSFYAFPFGAGGDIPAPADYDGDGKADAAVFRPSNSTWYVQRSSGGTTIQAFGTAGDVPVAADYDGDGKADLAIYRPNGANGSEWWILRSTAGLIATQFGATTDKTVVGDYTGDGKADVAFWRPSTGQWYILRSEDFSFYAFPFGSSGDIPVPGDYDGDGKTDAAVFRPTGSTWFAQGSTSGTIIQQFGTTGDVPVPNEFVR